MGGMAAEPGLLCSPLHHLSRTRMFGFHSKPKQGQDKNIRILQAKVMLLLCSCSSLKSDFPSRCAIRAITPRGSCDTPSETPLSVTAVSQPRH